MSEYDWNAEAEVMADQIARDRPDRARGAIVGRQSRVSVLFGNEPGKDPASVQEELASIRDALDQQGIRILGFATAPSDSLIWAMIVESEDLALLDELVRGPDS